jgi:PAS domain S-box-containing protein
MISDGIIAISYFSIPVALIYFTVRRADFRFKWLAFLFSGFIVFCGITHLFSIWTIWVPDYGLEAVFKVLTAMVSVVTAVALWVLMPKALSLPSRLDIERKNQELSTVNRMMATLSGCNEAVVRAVDEAELLNGICRILVRQGGFSRAAAALSGAGQEVPTQVALYPPEPPEPSVQDGSPGVGAPFSVSLPLMVGGERIGEIDLQAPAPIAESADHARILQRLADTVGVGLLALRMAAARERAEQTLRANEARYRSLVETQLDMVLRLDRSGCFSFVNQTTCAMFGQASEALIGQHWRPFIHPDDQAAVELAIGNAFERPDRFILVEARTLTVQGPRWISWEGKALATEGEAGEVQASGRDITERVILERQLAESEGRFRTLFERNSAVKLLIDPATGAIVDANVAACRYYGYSKEHFVSMNISDINISPLEEILKKMASYASDEGRYYCFKHKLSSGEVRDVEIYAGPVESGGRMLLHSIIHDITDRRQAEIQIRRTNRILETLGRCNEAVARTRSESGLLNDVCRIMVEVGGFRLAWIGFARQDADSSIEPVGQYGFEDGYLETIAVSWADNAHGHGPVGIALRTGQPCLFDDIATNPAFEVWRPMALERGYRSVLGLPLRARAEGIGVLVLYGAEPMEFSPEQIGLLSRLADNLAFGIQSMRDAQIRRQAEAALQASSEALKEAQRLAHLGSWTWEVATGQNTWSDELFRIYGLDPEAFVPRHDRFMNTVLAPEDRPRVISAIDLALKGEQDYDLEFRILRPDGTPRMVHAQAAVHRDRDGLPVRMVGTCLDISERKSIEQALKSSMEEAESASRAKSEFLANMSHEIRTPMNAIIGIAQLVLQTNLSTYQKEYCEKLLVAARSLLGILNDILDFSKVEAGRLDLGCEDFNINVLTADLATVTSVNAREKNIEVLFSVARDVPCWVVGDALRLQQVLINLIGNAIKFTESGEVVLSIRCLEKEAEHVVLEFAVRDTGIGIAPEHMALLFQPFSQGDSTTTRRFGGTGLGLAISSRLVALMGGRIEVDSEPGRGSTFLFTASLGVSSYVDEAVSKGPDPLPQDLAVLVVDDNPTARVILADTVNSLGWTGNAVGSGGAAVELFRKASEGLPAHVVLMDWHMPDMDGLEACQRIRDASRSAAPPVLIMVSAFGRDQMIRRSRELGVQPDAFLDKPITASTLHDTVAALYASGQGQALAPRHLPEHDRPRVAALAGVRILVVEDNPVNLLVAREILVKMGAEVEGAANGLEALRWFDHEDVHFDIILMDVQMPEMDGYQATRRLRQNPRGRDLPIIAITANAMASDREKCLAAGMNDYIAKPFDIDQIGEMLLRWIGRKPLAPRRFEPVEAVGPIPTIEGLDLAFALERLGGDRSLLLRFLRAFGENYRKTPDDLLEAVEAGKTDLAERLAHSLKGAALQVGAREVITVAGGIERAVAAGVPAAALEIDRLRSTLKRAWVATALAETALVRQAPASWSAAGEDCGLGPAQLPELSAQLAALRLLVLKNSFLATRSGGLLHQRLRSTAFQDLGDELARALDRLDYDKALETIDTLAENFQALATGPGGSDDGR